MSTRGTHLVLGVNHLEREGARLLHNSLELSGRGVASLGLAGLAREDDELALVELQALHIGLERLGRAVLATVVDGNANSAGVERGDAGFLHDMRMGGPKGTKEGPSEKSKAI